MHYGLHDGTVKCNEIWEIISDSECGYHLFIYQKTAREIAYADRLLLFWFLFEFPENLKQPIWATIYSFFFHLMEEMRSVHLVCVNIFFFCCIGESYISFETVRCSIFMGNSNKRNEHKQTNKITSTSKNAINEK